MREILSDFQQALSENLGINFIIKLDSEQSDTRVFQLRPEDPEYPHGFSINVTFFWKRYEVKLILDSYASQILLEMEKNRKAWNIFTALSSNLNNSSTDIKLRINDVETDPYKCADWPNSWNRFSLLFIKYGADFNIRDSETLKPHLFEILSVFNLMISLMPLEENEIDIQETMILSEGRSHRIEVNRYERNPRNRLTAVTLHGVTCKICGFNFEEKYGLIGKGFIHIHHVVPVSEVNDTYQFSIKDDLVPVCPNCHALIHRRKPYLTIEDMKKTLGN